MNKQLLANKARFVQTHSYYSLLLHSSVGCGCLLPPEQLLPSVGCGTVLLKSGETLCCQDAVTLFSQRVVTGRVPLG